MHRYCLAHGAAVIFEKGLAALGYPPTWVTTGWEVLGIEDALAGRPVGLPKARFVDWRD